MVTMHRLSKVLVALAAMMGQVESIGLTQGDGKMGKANTTMPSMLLEGQRSTMRREGKTAAEYSIGCGTFNPQHPGHEAIATLALYRAHISTHTKWDADDVVGYMRGVFWNDDPDGLLFDDETLAWDDEDEHSSGTAWICTFQQCNGYFYPTAAYGVILPEPDGDQDETKNHAFVAGCDGADVDYQLSPPYADTMLCRSHFFDLQFLHAMASESCKCPAQIRVGVYHWAEFAFNTARGNVEYKYYPDYDTYTLKGFDACSKIEANSVGGAGGGPLGMGTAPAWTTTPVINVGSLQLGGIVDKGWRDGGNSKGLCIYQSSSTYSECTLIMLFRSPTDEANICATTCLCSPGNDLISGSYCTAQGTGRPLLYNECDWTGAAADCNRPGMWLDDAGDCTGADSCMCGGMDTTRRRSWGGTRRRDNKGAYAASAKSSCVKCDDHDGGIRLNTRQRGAGSLLHLIQDSYGAAHTVRIDGTETACKYQTEGLTAEGKKNCGLLVQFSNYDGQDAFGDTHKFYDVLDEHPDSEDVDIDELYGYAWGNSDVDLIGHSPGNVESWGASIEVLRAAFTMDGIYQRDTYGYQRRRFGQAFRLDMLPGHQVIDVPAGTDRVTLEYKLATDILLLNDPDNTGYCFAANIASGSWNSDVTNLQAWVQSKCQLVSGPGLFRHSDSWQPRHHDMGTLVNWERTQVTIADHVEYNCNKVCPCDNSDDHCPDTTGRWVEGADPYAGR